MGRREEKRREEKRREEKRRGRGRGRDRKFFDDDGHGARHYEHSTPTRRNHKRHLLLILLSLVLSFGFVPSCQNQLRTAEGNRGRECCRGKCSIKNSNNDDDDGNDNNNLFNIVVAVFFFFFFRNHRVASVVRVSARDNWKEPERGDC